MVEREILIVKDLTTVYRFIWAAHVCAADEWWRPSGNAGARSRAAVLLFPDTMGYADGTDQLSQREGL